MANRERVVEFAVKARDDYSKVLKNIEQQQNKLSAAAQAANRRTLLGNVKSEVDDAVANYKRLTAEVARYQAALDNGRKSGSLNEAEMRELGETISLTRKRSLEAIDALNRHRTALNQLNGEASKNGYAAFNRLASAMEKGAVVANQESAAIVSQTTQLNKLTTASNTAAKATDVLTKKQNALRNSTSLTPSGKKGEAQSVEIYGLKPYQLTNLGYQVNDVISGLAMGQRPLQVLAQQAGQFAQIWPNTMVVLARSIPVIAGVTAVLAPFIATALRLKTAVDSLEIFRQELALTADGSRYSAQELVKITERMGEFGIATDKARGLVKQFIKDGIDQRDFAPLAQMAERLSAITGDDIGDAGKKLSAAFSGGVAGVRELDRELNFLTASQYAQIEAMAKAGNTAGALSLAQDILAGRLANAAEKTSAWGEAAKSAGQAWNALLDIIEKSGLLSIVNKELDKFGKDLANAANDLARNVKQVKGFMNTLTGNVDTNDLEAVRAKLIEINDIIAKQAKLLEAGQPVYADTKALAEQRDRLQEIVDRRELEVQAIRDGSAAERERAALSEADKKARLDIQAVIDKQGKALTDETRQANLTNRERYIEGELLKAKNAALEKAKALNQDILDLTSEQTKQIRNQAGMAYDATHPNYEAQYVAQRNSPAGAQMSEIVKFAAIIADQLKLDVKDILTAISYETMGTFNPSIRGGAGNNYVGLFQAGPAVQQKYGIDQNSSIQAQMEAMAKYLVDAGVKAGDGLLQIYAAINAGNAKNINASDERNGGAPGTVLDKVSGQMSDHEAKAQAILAAYAGIAEQAKKTAEYEKDFKARTDAAQAQLEAKTKETREAAINKAVVEETNRAIKAGVTLTQQQLDLVRQQAGAEFDRAHANDQVNQLVAQRTALFQSLQIAQQAGDQGKVASTIELIAQVEEKLKSAIPAAIAFWQAIGGAGADQEIAKLKAIQEGIGQTLQKIDKQFLPSAVQINEQLADIGGNAFSAFAQALANGENAAQAFFNALLQGIADFLIEIGKAIVKQALFNALSGGAGAGGSGGIGGAIGGWLASIFHEGGVIGGAAPSRMVNPAVFANAAYHHTGGLVGLAANERPVIAEVGEEMLTRDDPRHVLNGGKRGNQAVNIKNINLFNPADALEHALSTVDGEKVIWNFLSRNPRKLQGILNGS